MTLTVRSASIAGAVTASRALTHAEMDANWAHVIDSSNQSFLQSGSGAIATSVQAVLRGWVTPQMFGAVADGVTDDSVALQAAIATGKGVYLPDGTYLHATALTIPRATHAAIVGNGPTHSILKYTGSGKALSYTTDIVNVVRAPILRDFMIDCQASTATHGLHLSNGASGNGFSWGDISNLYIFGSAQAGSIGLLLDGVVYSTFNNVISRNWGTCIDSSTTGVLSSNNTFIRCVAIDGIDHGIRTRLGTWGHLFQNCTVEGDSARGWYIQGTTSGTFPERHIFIDCGTEDDHATADFEFENCRNVVMTGGGPGTNTTGDGLKLTNVRSSTFSGITLSTTDALKFSLILDANCQLNDIRGFSRDTRNLTAFSIGNNRNTWQFNFTSNATSPLVIGGNGPATKIRATTGGTIDPRDNGTYIADASGGNITLTLSTVTAQNEGVEIEIKKKPGDTNTVTIDPSSTQTVDANDTFVMRYDEECVKLRADFTLGGWRVIGHYNQSPYVTMASAGTLTIPVKAEVIEITGTTNVTDMAVISAGQNLKGKRVTLIFQDILTFTAGNKLKIAGNFVTSADDTITIACNGSNWYEVARSVNA